MKMRQWQYGMAVIGGSIGAWLGMKIWHHKTLHNYGNGTREELQEAGADYIINSIDELIRIAK
ncbi:MAG: DUF1294 domain-containing protein [Prevotella sp.]|nr:DUF1294 domain-containing protein [Prevotella sp.]